MLKKIFLTVKGVSIVFGVIESDNHCQFTAMVEMYPNM